MLLAFLVYLAKAKNAFFQMKWDLLSGLKNKILSENYKNMAQNNTIYKAKS